MASGSENELPPWQPVPQKAGSQLPGSRSPRPLLDIKDLEKKIVVEVREAVRQIRTEAKRIQATSLARKLAQRKLDAEEKKFEVGLSTSFKRIGISGRSCRRTEQ